MQKVLLFTSLLIMLPSVLFSQTTWQQTAGNISFTIKNRGANVTGHFNGLQTTLVFSPDNLPSSSLKGVVSASTINTGIRKRDEDLQGEKYFDAEKFKTIEISSTRLTKNGAQYTGVFNVTMKGVTKQMEIPFQFIEGENAAEWRADFTLNRRDFGIGTKGGLAIFMADDVHVNIDVKAMKKM